MAVLRPVPPVFGGAYLKPVPAVVPRVFERIGGGSDEVGTPVTLTLFHGDENPPVDAIGTAHLAFGGTCGFSNVSPKFGAGSIAFNNDGGITLLNSDDSGHFQGYNVLGTGDYIMDGWLFPTHGAANRMIIEAVRTGTKYWTLFQNAASNALQWQTTNGSFTPVTDLVGSTGVTLNAWNHILHGRTAGVAYIGLNGVIEASGADVLDRGIIDSGGEVRMGVGVLIDTIRGRLDEWCVRAGVGLSAEAIARGTYTVPTAPRT